MVGIQQQIRRHIQEDWIVIENRYENLKSRIILAITVLDLYQVNVTRKQVALIQHTF